MADGKAMPEELQVDVQHQDRRLLEEKMPQHNQKLEEHECYHDGVLTDPCLQCRPLRSSQVENKHCQKEEENEQQKEERQERQEKTELENEGQIIEKEDQPLAMPTKERLAGEELKQRTPGERLKDPWHQPQREDRRQQQGKQEPLYILLPSQQQQQQKHQPNDHQDGKQIDPSQVEREPLILSTMLPPQCQMLSSDPEEARIAWDANGRGDCCQNAPPAILQCQEPPAPGAIMRCKVMNLISEACQASLEHSRSPVWSLSCKDSKSSMLVQEAIGLVAEEISFAQHCGDQMALEMSCLRVEALLAGLHGHVRTALEHPHANYVLRKAAEVLPTQHLSFMVTELKGRAVWASQHRFGCRTILRLVPHCRSLGWVGCGVSQLVDELLLNAYELACDQFANYVLQEILEHGYPRQRQAVALAMLTGLDHIACNQQGCRVVERALRVCEPQDIQTLVDAVLGNTGLVERLAASQYGCLVLKTLLKSEQHSSRTALVLQPLSSNLRQTRQGRRLLGLVLESAAQPWEGPPPGLGPT